MLPQVNLSKVLLRLSFVWMANLLRGCFWLHYFAYDDFVCTAVIVLKYRLYRAWSSPPPPPPIPYTHVPHKTPPGPHLHAYTCADTQSGPLPPPIYFLLSFLILMFFSATNILTCCMWRPLTNNYSWPWKWKAEKAARALQTKTSYG